MNRKIPADAFSYYFSLGPSRSYEAVAAKYGVTKRGVAEHALREKWQALIVEAEKGARVSAQEKAQESLEEMNDRHMREARFLQSKGVEALKSGRPEMLAPGTRAVAQGMQLERLIRGEPTERTENVEAIIKREYQRWLKPADGSEADGAASPDDSSERESDTDGSAAHDDGGGGDDARDAAA